MEGVKNLFYKGLISEDEYKNEAIKRSIHWMVQKGYRFLKCLGTGAYGTVYEAKNESGQSLAIKVVLQECVEKGEALVWPKLNHVNVLPLFDIEHIPTAGTFVFVMPLIPTDLHGVLEDSIFSRDESGFHYAKSFLYDIMKAIKYLHDQKLCHLDIKPSNILISDSGKALVCDFGSLILAESGGVNNYVSPFPYRPAEAIILKNGKKTTINGFGFDVYTLGLLTFELFTHQAFIRSCQNIDINSTWRDQIYPRLFELLKKNNFKNAVKIAFPKSNIDKKFISHLRNFVTGCLRLNPRQRPSMVDILQHKIFGGSNLFPTFKNDVWKQKAPPKKIDFLVSLFIAQASSLRVPPDSENSSETEEQAIFESCESIDFKNKDELTKKYFQQSFTKRENFRQWITRKKSAISNRFNRVMAVFHRSGRDPL